MGLIESGENITALFMNPKTIEAVPEEPETEFPETKSEVPSAADHVGEDHPAVKFFDFAIAASIPICEKSNITPPDKATYDTFGRACINEAAWNYLPETSEEAPKWVSLVLAAGCLLIIFAPTALSFIEKQKEKQPVEELPEQAPEPVMQLAKLPSTETEEREITEPIV